MRTFAELRKSKGYTLSHIAKYCDLSIVFVGEIEHGKKSGSIITVKKLAECFGISIDEMVEIISYTKLAKG